MIISGQDINYRIASIFPDSAILDLQFNIVGISQNILEATGYTRDDVTGKPVAIFSAGRDFKAALETWLVPGYFGEQTIELRCMNNETRRYSVSGFYMGLIADVNGLIIVKFKNLEEVHQAKRELVAKSQELDEFVYTSSHSLRGPLATMKGLINLANTTQNPGEIAYLIQQMGVFAEKLDEKLHQLIYVAESDKAPTEDLSIQLIFNTLSASLQESSIDFPVDFRCPVYDSQQLVDRGSDILSMLNNLALFFSQQPKNRVNLLVLDILSGSSATEIMMRCQGFLFSESLVEKIGNVNFGYWEILNIPELLNYYAAKKIMRKLEGTVQFMHISSDEVVVLMTIPKAAMTSSIDFPPTYSITRAS